MDMMYKTQLKLKIKNLRTNFKLRHLLTACLLAVCLFLVTGGQPLQAETEKEIFSKVKIAMFDGKWDRALSELDRLTKEFPQNSFAEEILLYKGKCWKEKKNPEKSLEFYDDLLKLTKKPQLIEDALNATIDLNFMMYEKGKKNYIQKVVDLLKSDVESVKYFAAFKLSYVKDKTVANKAAPILKTIISDESDESLVDRARIALLRIDPKLLNDLSDKKKPEYSQFYIKIIDKETNKETFSISIPVSLASLVLDSIPEEQQKLIEKEGFDLTKIMKKLKESIGHMRFDDEETTIEIGLK
jgi:tetratricopeptide (TPR) repeat protein